jgi:hypothetical protein
MNESIIFCFLWSSLLLNDACLLSIVYDFYTILNGSFLLRRGDKSVSRNDCLLSMFLNMFLMFYTFNDPFLVDIGTPPYLHKEYCFFSGFFYYTMFSLYTLWMNLVEDDLLIYLICFTDS